MIGKTQGSAYPDQVSTRSGRVHHDLDAGGSRVDHDAVFAALTPRLTARASARVWTGDGFGRSRKLGRTTPPGPVALYLYNHGWTKLLVFDLDAKIHGADAVARDAAWLVNLIEAAGGAVVEDHNPASDGRHLYVLLAEPVRLEHVRPLLKLLGRFTRTLDPTPMLNPATGCIVPPGSWTKEGRRRRLVGALPAAIDKLTVGSQRGLISRIHAELGATTPLPQPSGQLIPASPPGQPLSTAVRLTSPLPDHIVEFATSGILRDYWPTKSEARQSVLAACALRGWSLGDIQDHMNNVWSGLSSAYDRYRSSSERALQRDWQQALDWATANVHKYRSTGHKKQHTGGQPLRGVHHDWLAHANSWAARELSGSRKLHTVSAVLQALAYCSAVAGDIVNSSPVVEVGRRSLSIAAGLIPDTTVGDVLAELREMEGSPLLRVRQASGVLADKYALVGHGVGPVGDVWSDRSRVEPVHPAWRIVGLHLRRAYELVLHSGLRTPPDIYAAAGLSATAGSEVLSQLAAIGLVARSYGRCEPGTRTLDDIADAHGLDEVRTEVDATFKRERDEWHAWLELRASIPDDIAADPATAPAGIPTPPPGWDQDDEALWSSRIATGPPIDQPDARSVTDRAIELLMGELGATILSP